MKALRVVLISIFAFLFLSGCGEDDASPEYDVYVYGRNNEQAAYWKNGQLYYLTEGTEPSVTSSAVFSGPDFYVAGMKGNGSNWVPVYWKNGVQVALSDGSTNQQAGGMSVSGTDVYIAGYEFRDGTMFAKYWKNGTPKYLNDGTAMCGAIDILVAGNDVHVIGFETKQDSVIARYWKNGVLIKMPVTAPYGYFEDIGISGDDIYIVGYTISENGQHVPKYWKNGVEVTLTAGIRATAIEFYGSDVYILDGSSGLYWKNGETHMLPDEGLDHVAPVDIAVAENDVFVAANNLRSSNSERLGGYLWKRNVAQSPFLGNNPGEELAGLVIRIP